MFKIHRGLSPEILRETFVFKPSSYNLCRNDTFEKRKVKSVCHGTESLSFLAPKNMGFSTSGIETVRYPLLLQVKNKELSTL